MTVAEPTNDDYVAKKLISENYAGRDSDITGYSQGDHDEIRDLLLGHRVAKIADDHLELDDGTVVKVVPNDGECLCSAGDYDLTVLNECDNIITAVDFDYTPLPDDGYGGYEDEGYERTYSVFVVAEDKRINLYAVEGSDGNGYYGTGYELLVRFPINDPDA